MAFAHAANPFLHISTSTGQFGYAGPEPERVPFNFFYLEPGGAEGSTAQRALRSGLPIPAWGTIECYRLENRLSDGVRAAGRGQHFHPTDLRRFARQEKAGYSAVQFYRLHPELGGFLGLGPGGPPPLPSVRRQRLREELVRALQKWPVSLPRLWEETLRFHYIRGLHRGWRDSQEEILREAG